MTVEASLALPLFLLFFMSLGSFIEMIRLSGNLQLALWKTGTELAVYGGTWIDDVFGEEEEGWEKPLDMIFSSVYVKSRILDAAGREYLNGSPLTRGTDSLQLWESSVFDGEDEIDLIVTYSVSPVGLTSFFPFRLANRYYAHVWNGYAIPGAGSEMGVAYVTVNASVYHLDRDCTHLRLSVRCIEERQLPFERNADGRKYQLCGKCGDGEGNTFLYISREGDKYHYSPGCPGLKRTVTAITLEEAAAAYPPCSRCGKDRQEEQ